MKLEWSNDDGTRRNIVFEVFSQKRKQAPQKYGTSHGPDLTMMVFEDYNDYVAVYFYIYPTRCKTKRYKYAYGLKKKMNHFHRSW